MNWPLVSPARHLREVGDLKQHVDELLRDGAESRHLLTQLHVDGLAKAMESSLGRQLAEAHARIKELEAQLATWAKEHGAHSDAGH